MSPRVQEKAFLNTNANLCNPNLSTSTLRILNVLFVIAAIVISCVFLPQQFIVEYQPQTLATYASWYYVFAFFSELIIQLGLQGVLLFLNGNLACAMGIRVMFLSVILSVNAIFLSSQTEVGLLIAVIFSLLVIVLQVDIVRTAYAQAQASGNFWTYLVFIYLPLFNFTVYTDLFFGNQLQKYAIALDGSQATLLAASIFGFMWIVFADVFLFPFAFGKQIYGQAFYRFLEATGSVIIAVANLMYIQAYNSNAGFTADEVNGFEIVSITYLVFSILRMVYNLLQTCGLGFPSILPSISIGVNAGRQQCKVAQTQRVQQRV